MWSPLRLFFLLSVLLLSVFSRTSLTSTETSGTEATFDTSGTENSTSDRRTAADSSSDSSTTMITAAYSNNISDSSNSSSQSVVTSSSQRPSTIPTKGPMKSPTKAKDTAIMKKMHIHVQEVRGVVDSSHREKILSSVYVAEGKAVVLRAVSPVPVSLFQPAVNFSKLPRATDGGPQRYTHNGWCHRINPDTVYEEFDCFCFYGYGGIFCEEKHTSRGWMAGLWWSLILLETLLLLFALFRLWKRWTLKPTLEPVRFVEVIMSEDPNYVSSEATKIRKSMEPPNSNKSVK